MIYASEKGIKIVMVVVLLWFFLMAMYFMSEMKKVEHVYDGITEELYLNN